MTALNTPQVLYMEDEDGVQTIVESTSPIRNPLSSTLQEVIPAPDSVTKAAPRPVRAFGEVTRVRGIEVLLLPPVLQLLEFEQVVRLKELNKTTYKELQENPQQYGYWNAMCLSLCALRRLYTPYLLELTYMVKNHSLSSALVKKHFWKDLWPARKKWSIVAEEQPNEPMQDAQAKKDEEGEFKICVACRFRPGARNQNEMNLPLHQFLKLRRKETKLAKQLENNDAKDNSDKILVGEQDPVEFVDPFLNSLMRNPVLLTTSNRIIEKAIAVQCLLRNGRDPFNARKLSRKNIIPQPELQQRINDWKEEKERKTQEGLRVDIHTVKSNLIDGSSADPELLEMLQEAEKMSMLADKTERLARNRKKFHCDNPDTPAGDGDGAAEEEETAHAVVPVNGPVNDENENNSNQQENSDVEGHEGDGSNDKAGWRKTQEAPRVIDVSEAKAEINMHVTGVGVRSFNFSHVYDGPSTQAHLYDSAIKPTVGHVLNGFNSSILCYGQTGSGKTHTFFGPSSTLDFSAEDIHEYMQDTCPSGGSLNSVSHANLPDSVGLSVRTCIELLLSKKHFEARGVKVSISLQYIEIHENTVTDLLTGEHVDVRRDNGELVNASEVPLEDVPSMLKVLQLGQERKRFAATAMNDRSSRSHTAMILQVLQVDTHYKTLGDGEDSSGGMLKSILHLVDLAGSERVKKSKVSGKNFDETVGINSSLLVLGKCIAALVESKSHVPYLESKLTTMLRAAFGGNSRTTAIVCARSGDDHGEETLQSLRFGERCSMISNKTKTAAQSAESTLAALNTAVAKVEEQLAGLERRGKSHLPSFSKLQVSYKHMQNKRDELAKMLQRKVGVGNAVALPVPAADPVIERRVLTALF